jgi:hypothetical protein
MVAMVVIGDLRPIRSPAFFESWLVSTLLRTASPTPATLPLIDKFCLEFGIP